MNVTPELIFILILCFVTGNLAGRVDALAGNLHKNCVYTINLYYYALCGICYNTDREKQWDLFNSYLTAAKTILDEDIKNGKRKL